MLRNRCPGKHFKGGGTTMPMTPVLQIHCVVHFFKLWVGCMEFEYTRGNILRGVYFLRIQHRILLKCAYINGDVLTLAES